MIHALELPWGQVDELKEKFGLRMMKGGISLYTGALIPAELRPFTSEDFSYARWVEDERNAIVMPPNTSIERLLPNKAQEEGAQSILKSYEGGKSGIFIGEPRGSGKKLTALSGLTEISKAVGFGNKNRAKLLVVCPKGQEARWRSIIRSFPISTSLMRILVINYSQLNKLLVAPPQARITRKAAAKSRGTAKSGEPTINWDFIIFDESQALNGYPKNKNALEAASVAQLNTYYTRSRTPFVIFNSPTPGSSPLDFALMSKIVSTELGAENEIFPKNWVSTLTEHDFTITEGRYGPIWCPEPRKATPKDIIRVNNNKRKEVLRIARALKKSPECIVRSTPPEFKTSFVPINMSSSNKVAYKEIWSDLKKWINKNPADNSDDFKKQLAKYRSKLGYMKGDSILDEVLGLKDFGHSFLICVPSPANADRLIEKLTAKKINTMNLTGTKGKEAEDIINAFLEEEVQALVYSGDTSDLYFPGMSARTGFSPLVYFLDSQKETNVEENSNYLNWLGEKSLYYFTYFENTIEERIIAELKNNGRIDDKRIEREFRLTASKAAVRNRLS